MANPIKRLNYFNGQFLRAPDFTEEQTYHLEMRRRHNENLHTWGIADGLKLQYTIGSSQIEIAEGMAIDSEGREIVLVEKANKDLSGFVNKTVYVTIAHEYKQVDKTNETGVEGFTRVQEIPTINISENPPSADQLSLQLILGRVTVNSEGKITATDEGEGVNRRRAAGVVAGDLEARSLTLTDTNVDPSQWSRMRLGAAGRADLQSNLRVTGNLEVTGTVDGRDVSADGTELDSHTSNTNNPHQTTAALIDNQGGTNRLVTQINASTGVINEARIDPAIARDSEVTTLFNTHANRLDNPHSTTAAQVGALPTTGGTISGALTVTDQLTVNGGAKFTGPKTGYVVDAFVNASEQRLRTGDLVTLKGTPIHHFYGDNNKIPVPEVTLADTENDSRVIGIVDRESIPDQNSPDTRVEPDDPTFVENGGELLVVTLGAYAHCKVDATEAPIEVGDLLTSSNNPGHAKKATEPKLGSIIGKALESLKEGTGYIAVFVNIQ
ncbi:MAG: hypothetical protein EWV83_13210 [Microcystis sp. M_OC_Ca_00000000_S217Cul]|uniref:Uncharacterized protein n=1 Tax=Microcystis aeruginosa BLCC-F108 TaxID=2755317 RepID=A0A841UK87_MICAE|nr:MULTISPECIES: hypothetical protein [Microcystis]MBC1190758.1 hypothetical protein [Microcystis aeruginosa BLCC-F108]MCA2590800.1 hypothetical protein [Microcystis sp. M31BS1]MDB9406972.1 hypothetical protein [Microcystis aeruginosa CS-558/01A06]TRT75440.1 MAG: hypothetical protein EWV83_13210 [Microcystis sp. M_OC_Ca_00000000_S217Cul]TRT84498.1 MAG: hypothetical protein EWV66_20330 [Microcystis sp. M_OC_Ca_00000000_C217Col]